ncbi:MAG: DEAD/DEAH box helicase family protein [Candidatus Brocadiales bacterium]|nr:DEAD/DEAH box helicase family protein [Candidatus Brocadiales bacterium]
MTLAVDNPILNNPFEEPARHWQYVEGQPTLVEERRLAGYYMISRTRSQPGAYATEDFVPLDTVNEIRRRVKRWREAGYPGTTRPTRELLNYWSSPDRERRLFYCQREAVETIIWLAESTPAEKQGITIPKDEPNDPKSIEKGYKALSRYACKMATGSGKTIVMGMLIAWSVLNKFHNRQDTRFSDAVLMVCPNLTIWERLQVLRPEHPKNYYTAFDLVPCSLREGLNHGKYLITNWHLFNPIDDTGKKSVVKLGPESDPAFCRRVLESNSELGNLGSKENILVLNDEGHHAYRPGQKEELENLSAGERRELEEEFEEATVWVGGLDRINAVRGLNLCIDLSATPFYIKGSGRAEGKPFPWVVSDFGLVDAIESGIVKIPRVPVDDNTGEPIPRYFRLWEWINQQIPASERQTARRRAKPESVLRQAEDALGTLASEWKKTFDEWQKDGAEVPPAMIVVCDNTDLSKLVAGHIDKGEVLPELKGQEVTLRIDTKLLKKEESAVEGETKEEREKRLRDTVNTVGKTEWEGEGEPPGKDIRCVVSVGMLTEGWDAQNVTQILGLRAFTSQLLCEQVVGRGLRRTNYDDFEQPEYVDVYGIPFEVIPVKKAGKIKIVVKPSILVQALKERKNLEITFPRVEGYVFDVKHRIKCDVSKIPKLEVDPSRAPTEVIVKGAAGYRLGRPDRLGPGTEAVHNRNPFHTIHPIQSSVYKITSEITNRYKPDNPEERRFLFPQVLGYVWGYLNERVTFVDAPPEEIALLKYRDLIVERMIAAIEPDTEAGEPPLLPIIERLRPTGSTSEVLFRTKRPCYGTTKSHVSHVVADSPVWEHSVAYQLERLSLVIAYVKNDHLDFEIPYEYEGVQHPYRPDFLIRLHKEDGSEARVILEVKGFETEKDRAKEAGAIRWVKAVNYHGQFGRWEYIICKDPRKLKEQVEGVVFPQSETSAKP